MFGIDLGSNTLRAVELDEKFLPVKEAEFVIGAAKNLQNTHCISTQAISRLKQALQSLKEQGFDLKKANAVATAAFRKAKNTEEIFAELKAEFGIKFRVIDAKEEARLSILGMQNALKRINFKEKQLAFCDLGGASCELSFGKSLKSFDFGIISFFEKVKNEPLPSHNLQFKLKNKTLLNLDKKIKLHFLLKDKMLKSLAFKAFDEVALAKRHLRNFKNKVVVLNSGVPTTLLALKQDINYKEYEAKYINGKFLKREDFLFWGIKLWEMSEKEAILKVGANRKKYLVAGCFLLYALFEKQKLVVVDEGLREGVCLDLA